MSLAPLGAITRFLADAWDITFLLIDAILRLLKVVLALGILAIIGFIIYVIGLSIGAALGFIDLKPVSFTAAKHTSTDSSSGKSEDSSPRNPGQDTSGKTDSDQAPSEKRRLEIEIEILEDVLRARRAKLAQLS